MDNMDNKDIEKLTEFMLGDSVPKMLDMIHENENLKKEVEELKIYKENYQMLKKEIESLYNGFMCCEVSLHADELEEI